MADVEDVGTEPGAGILAGRHGPQLNRQHTAHLQPLLAAAIERLARLIPEGLIQRWERAGHNPNARGTDLSRATLHFRSNSHLGRPDSSA